MLADMYIEMYNRAPTNFKVPQEHKKLQAIVEHFHDKPTEFVKFVRKIRDEAAPSQYDSVHEIFRRVQSRRVQQDRRRRLKEGVSLIEKELNVGFNFKQKEAVAMWLEQYWGRERILMLDEARRNRGRSRLNTEERSEICELFWAKVDNDLKHSIIPTPPEIVYGKLASLESYKPNSI